MSQLTPAEEIVFKGGENSGRRKERERIIKALEEAPPAFDFYGPYLDRKKVLDIIKGEN